MRGRISVQCPRISSRARAAWLKDGSITEDRFHQGRGDQTQTIGDNNSRMKIGAQRAGRGWYNVIMVMLSDIKGMSVLKLQIITQPIALIKCAPCKGCKKQHN